MKTHRFVWEQHLCHDSITFASILFPVQIQAAGCTLARSLSTRQVAALLGRATTIIRAVERALHAYPEGQ